MKGKDVYETWELDDLNVFLKTMCKVGKRKVFLLNPRWVSTLNSNQTGVYVKISYDSLYALTGRIQ